MQHQYPEIYSLVVATGWLAFVALFYLLLRKIIRDIGHGAPDFFRILVSEFKSLKSFKFSSPGAINALAILTVLLIAVITIVALEVEKIIKILINVFGQKVEDLPSLGPYLIATLVVTAVVAVASVHAVAKFEKIDS